MAHVLIGFGEALPAPEVVFSLRRAGHMVSAFARTSQLSLRHLALEQLIVLPAPEHDAIAAVEALREFMQAPGAPDIVLPLDDIGLWLCDSTLGADLRNVGARGPQACLALDKEQQIAAAARAGLAVPATVLLRTPADVDNITTFPAIAKPALALNIVNGRVSKGYTTYLMDSKTLTSLRDRLRRDHEVLLVQPLISGVGEGVFGHATPEGVVAWSGHRRLRMMNPHGSGSSACVSMQPDASLLTQIQEFLKNIRWNGPFMIELLRDAQGTAWFMELNGRMWGSLALARRQGLEYPAWAVAQRLDPAFRPVVPSAPLKPVLVRNLGRDLLHLAFVLRGPKSAFHRTDWPRFWSSAAGVFTPAHPRSFYNYDSTHPSFFLREALWTIRSALRR